MNLSNIVLYDSDYQRLREILLQTQRELNADLVLLIDRSGQHIACEGPAQDVDLTSLASLAAANMAATEGLAGQVGEAAFSALYHQGKQRSIHISDVSKRFSLVLLFANSVSLGMVRWRVRRATASLEEVFQGFMRRMEARTVSQHSASDGLPTLHFSDDELDALFGNMKPKS